MSSARGLLGAINIDLSEWEFEPVVAVEKRGVEELSYRDELQRRQREKGPIFRREW